MHVLAIGMLTARAEGQPQFEHGVHQPVKREVLALTSTMQVDRGGELLDHVHDLLQTPLNHLGMVVREHDISSGPPTGVDFTRLRAIVTYFHGNEPATPWLWPWLHRAMRDHDLRIVHFGDFGPLAPRGEDRDTDDRLEEWLQRFGLAYDPGFLADPARVRSEFFDPELTCFESRPVHQLVHTGPWSWGRDNLAWVTTADRKSFGDVRSPVVTGPWGGIALQPWMLSEGRGTGDLRWYLDPFSFLTVALGLDGVPVPDPSVLYGRRMFVLHIDGDGFESISTARHGELSAKVMLDDVIDRYQLPVTASVIIASLTDDMTTAEDTPEMRLAREILNRPNVEPATHTVLHPLNWRGKHTSRSVPRTTVWYQGLDNYRHDMAAEVTESVRFVNERLLDSDRRCRLVLWSGLANPTEEVIASAGTAGCLNLNGGVYRWDALHNSVGYVTPWGKQLGDAFQIYCGAANENVFEGFFTSMPRAFGHIDQTLRNTGAPRILKPANIYIHFYSAERPARLRELHRLIERWAFRESTIPVFASTYASAVLSAQTACQIDRTPGGWSFSNFGQCRTVRIDGETRSIDWEHSSGLVGARRINDSLYVHLNGPDADLVWARTDTASPHVEEANHIIRDVRLRPSGVDLLSEARHKRDITLAGFAPLVDLVVELDDETMKLRSDERGRAVIRLLHPGKTHIRVRPR